jgi:hypothetical protein
MFYDEVTLILMYTYEVFMKKRIVIGFISFLIYSVCNSRQIEKCLSVTVLEETVNGVRFAHRSDLVDGKVQEVWAINGRSVSYNDYLDAILDAEREERRKQRKLDDEKRRQEQEFKALAQINTLKKLIKIKINETMQELIKVNEPLLARYLTFDESTFASEEALKDIYYVIEEARRKCQESFEVSTSMLHDVLTSLERLPARLQKLYQDSVNYAIKTCDDTRYLKDLLSLVS